MMMRDAGVAIDDKETIRQRCLAVVATMLVGKALAVGLAVGESAEANTERKKKENKR